MLWQLAAFRDRDNFPTFLNGEGIGGYGVEVGTHRGEFAAHLALKWDCRRLYCVDNYASGYSDRDPVSSSDREEDYEAAKAALEGNAFICGKVRLLRTSSQDASGIFDKDALNFVYIDANHEREEFEKDLGLWFPKVKPGGILAGHDVICPGEPLETNWGAEIQPALWDFACRNRLVVYLVMETQSLPWSWYVRKPQ